MATFSASISDYEIEIANAERMTIGPRHVAEVVRAMMGNMRFVGDDQIAREMDRIIKSAEAFKRVAKKR